LRVIARVRFFSMPTFSARNRVGSVGRRGRRHLYEFLLAVSVIYLTNNELSTIPPRTTKRKSQSNSWCTENSDDISVRYWVFLFESCHRFVLRRPRFKANGCAVTKRGLKQRRNDLGSCPSNVFLGDQKGESPLSLICDLRMDAATQLGPHAIFYEFLSPDCNTLMC